MEGNVEEESYVPKDTEAMGEKLAGALKPGSVVAMRGGMGMGKTAFIRGLARGLGFEGRVTSPTFTIVNEYPAKTPLFHFDLYRISDADELYDIGWEDYLTRGGVCAVEWSEIAQELLSDADVTVCIARGEGDDERVITIEGGDILADTCH